jgi:hypothetical protein
MTRALVVLVLLASLVDAASTPAQIGRALDTGLRLEWTAEPTKRGGTQLSGYLYNDRDQWAASPRLLIETLDSAGQVIASTLFSAVSDVPPRSRSYFNAPVPSGAASYRMSVRYVDWRGYGAAGGS